jgi:LysM repeat protein
MGSNGFWRCGAVFGFVLVSTKAVVAQEACTTYTVKEGDSLGSIAQAAYGSFN